VREVLFLFIQRARGEAKLGTKASALEVDFVF
jgi:hypothetical protein